MRRHLAATLGIFLLMASRDPGRNTSLIWFTVWSSVVHALIMAYQSFADGALSRSLETAG